jgi:hypothetical protein
MAVFGNLHDAGTVLADILQDRIDPTLEVLAAPPIENPTAAGEAIRLTLLWVTPQPTHRNDPWEPNFEGRPVPPPVTLSAFYLVTAYGTAPDGQPAQAYNRLGQVLQVFDSEPRIELPQPPVTTLGEGAVGVVHVPTAADLMEKIYTPLQMRHRAWALFEVGPIQLQSLAQTGPEQPIVHPGGVHLGEFDTAPRPEIRQITPAIAAETGRLRLDATYSGPIDGVRVGDTVIAPAALTVPRPDGPILFTLPASVSSGFYDVTLHAAGAISAPLTLEVRDAATPSLDAPAVLTQSIAANLVLTGRALDTTTEVLIWPAQGVASPDDIITLAVPGPLPGQLTIPAASLAAAGIRQIEYRVTARVSPQLFTAFVLLEFTP